MFVANIGPVQVPKQLSAVIVGKIKHKHSQKESKFPLPCLTSTLPPCSRSLEFIQPLAMQAEAWQAIPGMSEWVMGIIKQGYSLQFARRPPRFSGVVSTSVPLAVSPRGLVLFSGPERRIRSRPDRPHHR